jgi:hypothetical protein
VEFLDVAFPHPAQLRLTTDSSQRLHLIDPGTLYFDDRFNEAFGAAQPVGLGEDLDAPHAIRRRRIGEPSHALLIVAERRHILQRVSDVGHRERWAGALPVEDPDRLCAPPDDVPRAKIAVADDLTRTERSRRQQPIMATGTEVSHDFVVRAK